MVRLKIDNKDYEMPGGITILDAARMAGINIPTLCHKEGLPHYSSCFVCVVKNNKTDHYIPSCSALVQDGMDISATCEEVIEMRRKAIGLLLSEHRAECLAPCQVVCPAGHNIPLMNRLLAAGKTNEATDLSLKEQGYNEIHCTGCPGYCENACRRKKIDAPVSIRNIQLFVFQTLKEKMERAGVSVSPDNTEKGSGSVRHSNKTEKKFVSHIGRIEEGELTEWLKECPDKTERHRETVDFETAGLEAMNCMHCDCRAVDNCKLRDISDEYAVKDPRGKIVNSPVEKKINMQTGLIFENAKCIKCGLCVRISGDEKEDPSLCFLHRGFISIISEPLTSEFNDILHEKSSEVIDICPTGALARLR